HKVRGVGVYTRELIKALYERTKEPRKASRRTSLRDESPRGKLKELRIEAVEFGKVDLSRYDLVHYPYFHPFFLTLPFNKPAKTVVTIHDLIPLIYPKHYPPGIRGKFKFKLQKYLIKRVDGIITPSETSKKDIVRFLGIPQEKIQVVYEAPRKIFKKLEIGNWKLEIKKRYGLPELFILYVGDVNYNKNILGLTEASRIAKVPLVIVGRQAADEEVDLSHPENRPFAELLKKYGNDPEIKRLGFVPDKELVAIYNLASVYCQPSFYEGFGLSVLEAMACGTPVIAARTQVLVEIGGDAALIADPKNPQDIAKMLKEVMGNSKTKEELIKKGLERVKDFSWTKAAKNTIEYYSNVIDD
ncbi:glycosyltransferase family 4 protein, partial [Patescibacteria group bacterium]|nr:glycosyltransferase family 4 protein [Patescibacteria group bacterium]